MASVFANISSDFLFAKLHGRLAEALYGEKLTRLINSGDMATLGRFLAAHGIEITHRADVQRKLAQKHIADLAAIMQLLDQQTGEFYAELLNEYFLQNLKTILHYYYIPNQPVDIEDLLIVSPHLPFLDSKRMLEAKSVHQIFSLLPNHPFKPQLLPILVELDDGKNLFAADCRIDKIYYTSLLQRAKKLPWSLRQFALQVLRTEIDIRNIIMALRNAQLYRIPVDELIPFCLDDGLLIKENHLRRLTEDAGLAEGIAALGRPYSGILQPLLDKKLYFSENALWNFLYKTIYSAYRDFNRPLLTIIAFPYLKDFELLNVGRVFEGFRCGLDSRDIRDMMVGAA